MRLRRPADLDGWAMLALIGAALALALLGLSACGLDGSRLAQAAAEPAAAAAAERALDLAAPPLDAVAADPASLGDARLALAAAEARLAAARARVDALESAQAEARREGHRRLLAWASGLAILGSLVCGGLAVALPILRRRLLAAAAACLAILILAQALAQALPWLPLIGAGLALLTLAAVCVALAWRLRAAVASVRLAIDRNDSAWPALRTHLLRAQGGEGHPIQRDLDRLAKAATP